MGALPEERFATVNGLRIHFLEWGSAAAQPMVLLHGIARMAQAFAHLAPHFADRHRVIAVDMRGHGDSGWHPQGAYLVDDYLSDIEALADALDLRDIVLWGNSTGGRVAQMYAGRHPARVAAVVSEDVGPERPQKISDRRARRMAVEEAGWATLDDVVAASRETYPRTAAPLLRAFAEQGSTRRADGRYYWKRDPAILKGFVAMELWDDVRRIRAPILYVLGGESSIVPAETRQQLRETLPQAEIVTMPGLGHYPSDEDPGAFLAIVDGFLARAAGARDGAAA